MPIAAGIFKQLAYKVEATYGTAPGQSGGQSLRRVQSTIDLSKDTYQSNELRTDLQVSDFRHGVRKVQGSINGELSPGTYKDFFAAILKRDFAAVTAISGQSVTIGAPTSGIYPFTLGGGSMLTNGFKVGMVIRLSVGSFNAANINKNIMITAIASATNFSGFPLNGVALVAEGPIATSTVTAVGKSTYVPTSGHTDKSFSIEHWYSDLVQSELFAGCKMAQCAIDLPPTGLATVSWNVMGQDLLDTAAKRGAVATTSQYFTTPTAQTTSASLASVNGVVRIGGVTVATLTGLQMTIAANFTGDPVVGANVVPNQFPGRVVITGQATMYFDGVTTRDAFVNETEVDIVCAFTTDNSATADFVSFVIPRVKFGGATKDDGEKGIVQTLPFQALIDNAGGTGIATEKTTLLMQDSLA